MQRQFSLFSLLLSLSFAALPTQNRVLVCCPAAHTELGRVSYVNAYGVWIGIYNTFDTSCRVLFRLGLYTRFPSTRPRIGRLRNAVPIKSLINHHCVFHLTEASVYFSSTASQRLSSASSASIKASSDDSLSGRYRVQNRPINCSNAEEVEKINCGKLRICQPHCSTRK